MNVRSEVVGEMPTRQSRRLETRLTQTNVHLWRASGRPGLCHTIKPTLQRLFMHGQSHHR